MRKVKNIKDKISNKLNISLGENANGIFENINLNSIPGLLIETNHHSETISIFNTILYNFFKQNSPENLRLAILNSKNTGFNYESLPKQYITYFGRKKIAKNGISASYKVLDLIIEEMETRYDLFMKAHARNIRDYNEKNIGKLPQLVLFINDFREFSNKLGKEFESTLARLVVLGKVVGIHVIIATSRVDLYEKSVFIDANFSKQMIFSREISDVSDQKVNDMKKELHKHGDYLFVTRQNKRSKVKRFQFPFITNKEFINSLKSLQQEV